MSFTNNPMIYMQRWESFKKKKKKSELSIIKNDLLVQKILKECYKEIHLCLVFSNNHCKISVVDVQSLAGTHIKFKIILRHP